MSSNRADIQFYLDGPPTFLTVKVSRSDGKPLSTPASVTVTGPLDLKLDTKDGIARFPLRGLGTYRVSLEPKGREARGLIAPVATTTAPDPFEVSLTRDN